MPNSKPDTDPRTTAYHEAGHTVMVYLLGQHVQGCTIVGDGLGEGWVSIDREGVSIDAGSLETAAKIGLGGLAAERKASRRSSVGGIHDLLFVLAFLECRDLLGEEDGMAQFADTLELLLDYEAGMELMKELGDRHRVEFRKMLHETGGEIDAHWDTVEMIAEALLEFGTLSGEQVGKIIEAAGAATA